MPRAVHSLTADGVKFPNVCQPRCDTRFFVGRPAGRYGSVVGKVSHMVDRLMMHEFEVDDDELNAQFAAVGTNFATDEDYDDIYHEVPIAFDAGKIVKGRVIRVEGDDVLGDFVTRRTGGDMDEADGVVGEVVLEQRVERVGIAGAWHAADRQEAAGGVIVAVKRIGAQQ